MRPFFAPDAFTVVEIYLDIVARSKNPDHLMAADSVRDWAYDSQ